MISIITPCFNSELFIDRAINSVLAQTYKDWELILVNNNSTDKTLDILNSYQDRYPERIRVFNETKKGAPAARNKGLKEAKGVWIQFLDADDEILPNKLTGQIELADKLHAGIVASPYRKQGTRGEHYFSFDRMLYTTDVWSALIFSQMGITSSNLWKKELLLAVNGWDENQLASQEYDLMFRILKLNPVVAFDDRSLTIVHFGTWESVSRTVNEKKGRLILESRINLRLRIKQYLKENDLLTEGRSSLINKFIYDTLVRNYRFRPNDVVDIMGTLELNVSIEDRIKGYYFMRKMDLRRFLYKHKVLK
jgi:glycosyltransferase involved in cell wall biosynthesis